MHQPAMKTTIFAVAVALLSAALALAEDLPAGTLLPVALSNSIRAGKAKPNERFSAKLAQYVVVNGVRLPRGTELSGRVIESQPAAGTSPARLVLAFDSIRVKERDLPITTSLRSLASTQAVYDAQLPTNMVDDYGSSLRDWNTTQVGGQAVYRGDGTVMEGPEVVGKASSVGEVFGKPKTWPWSACARDAVRNVEQSFWVFSTDACGVYGFEGLRLTHAGRKDPLGHIVLESPAKLEIRAGSGLLLMVLPSAQTSSAHQTTGQNSTPAQPPAGD